MIAVLLALTASPPDLSFTKSDFADLARLPLKTERLKVDEVLDFVEAVANAELKKKLQDYTCQKKQSPGG